MSQLADEKAQHLREALESVKLPYAYAATSGLTATHALRYRDGELVGETTIDAEFEVLEPKQLPAAVLPPTEQAQ